MVDMKKEKEPTGGMERVKLPEDLTTVEAPNRDKENLEVTTWIEKIEKQFARVPNDTSDVTDDTVVVQQPFGSAQGAFVRWLSGVDANPIQ